MFVTAAFAFVVFFGTGQFGLSQEELYFAEKTCDESRECIFSYSPPCKLYDFVSGLYYKSNYSHKK